MSRVHTVSVLFGALSVASVGTFSAAADGTTRLAPVPAPTHVPTDPCDAGQGAQRLCDEVDEVVDNLVYLCHADPTLATNFYYIDPLGYVTWQVQAYGGHSCPDRSGDLVRVTGTLDYEFNGWFDGPYTCFGMGGCSTASVVAYHPASLPAYFAVTQAATSTIDNPGGSVLMQRVHVYP